MKSKRDFLKRLPALLLFIALVITVALILLTKKSTTISPQEDELALKIGFDKQVLVLVKTETGKELKRLKGYNLEKDEEIDVNGLSFEVSPTEAVKQVYNLREKLTPLGYLAFLTERNFGIGQQNDEIGLLKTTDEYDILIVQHTNGYNYDIGPEEIITKLKEWDKRYSLEIIGADLDWFEARFSKAPDNIDVLAKEVYEFCPDVVDQGTETIEKLAQEMQTEKTLYCWWD